MKKIVVHLLVLLLLVPATALASRPRSSATLEVSFAAGLASVDDGGSGEVPYVVSGCGYDRSLGGVTVVARTPVAISFAGDMPDENGCIEVANFSTQGSGHYDLKAYQQVRNRSRVMAETSFDL